MPQDKRVNRRKLPPEEQYFEIGRTGTAEEVRQAHEEAGAWVIKSFEWGNRYVGEDYQTELRKGAQAAFLEGRVENLQYMLAHAEDFKARSTYGSQRDLPVRTILHDLSEAAGGAAGVLHLALGQMQDEEKQATLDNVLYGTIWREDESAFARTLLEAGAAPKANTLITAIQHGVSVGTVRMLHDYGASLTMRSF